MSSNTGSTETVLKYVVYRLPAIAAILFYWITMKAVQQLTGLTETSVRLRYSGAARYTVVVPRPAQWTSLLYR